MRDKTMKKGERRFMGAPCGVGYGHSPQAPVLGSEPYRKGQIAHPVERLASQGGVPGRIGELVVAPLYGLV